MIVIKFPAAVLAAIGRHGTIAVALSIFVGLFLPGLAATFKPYLGETVVVLLTLAFLRVEPAALRELARKPALVVSAVAWVMIVTPAALGLLFVAFGIKATMPDLYFILVLQICAPALMSSPAMAALIGVDVALTLAGLLLCTVLVPLTSSIFSYLFLGAALIDPLTFGVKLFVIIAGSTLAATLVRWLVGARRIEANKESIDGLSVVGMFLFAMSAMDGVLAHVLADPKLVAGLTLLAFALALGMMALTVLVFLPAGRDRAFAIALLGGNRNLGVMLTAIGFALPDLAWLYFGLVQFPIYLLPMVLKPLARRFTEKR